MKQIEKIVKLDGKTITLKTGQYAEQAGGAVMAQCGETTVLATVSSAPAREELDYFPLFVEYQERLYAGGIIKGSRWVKREGRPTDEEILTSRLIDRSLRPLFPKGFKNEVQVIITVLSVDLENDPSTLATIAASAAVAISPLPWYGPVATLKVGTKDDKFTINPTASEAKESDLDLVVSTTKDAIVMIEAAANEVPEQKILQAIQYGQKQDQKLIKAIEEFAKEAGTKKVTFKTPTKDTDLEKQIIKSLGKKLETITTDWAQNKIGYQQINEIVTSLSKELGDDAKPSQISEIVFDLIKSTARQMSIKGTRPDGRKHTQIRELSAQVGVLPRIHGSGLFQRGQTQVLSVTTLGSPSLGQLIETAEGEQTKRYMHHYFMPPYASGEVGRLGSPSRREIGHGALAERALLPVVPSEQEFPYAIRIVSEVMSSNGSTSMASVCGSTLSLMDAGVPIKAPVSGIAMGVIIDSKDKYAILTDIAGFEDHTGDMDFKIAGTTDGITALQLDVKTLNLTFEILEEAIPQAQEARAEILKTMLESISKPRSTVSAHAPKIKTVKINREKIGDLIGPAGKNIKKIIAESGADVDVEDDGAVTVSAISGESVTKAIEMVEALTKEVQPGEIYDGEVKRIQQFGAFVEILPGKDGLVHVSDMSKDFVKDPGDIVKMGDKVKVKVKEIDDLGRINLTMVLDGTGGGRSSSSGGRGGQNRGNTRGDYTSRPRKPIESEQSRSFPKDSTGPHFPTSRLMTESFSDRKRS